MGLHRYQLGLLYHISVIERSNERSEPNSRIALMDEQSNAWELLHPRAATSRHRGAEQGR